MAYNVNSDFRNKLYSGASEFKCSLIINQEEIPNNIISSISISSPIIDTNSDFFYVGSFISQQLTIKFKNLDGIELHSGDEVSLSISQYVNSQWVEVPIGLYLIDDLAENYHKTCEIKCLDYAVKFKPNIDYSPCFVNDRATIRTVLEWICSHVGVTLGDYPTTNDDVVVATYNSTVSGKQWISYIAELKGCNAKIDRNGRLTLKPLTTTAATTINAKKGSSFELGEKYKISRVTYFDAIRNFTYGNDNNNTLFIRQDNPFINDTSVVENIYNVVNGFEIYKLKAKNYGDFSLDAWDIINYQVGTNYYKTINNNTLTYAMTIMGEVNVNIPSKQQEVTTNVIEPNLRTVSATVDNVDKTVSIVVDEIGDRTGKTTSLTEDINRIEGMISEIADITTSGESQTAIVVLDDEINQSQPIEVKIQPINDNISYLYPNNGLYPSDTLYPKSRTLIFRNTTTNEDFIYELPTDLWIYNNEIYDSLYLQYGSEGNATVTVNRKCQIDSSGVVSPLDTPTTETYPYPSYIYLTDGHYTVFLQGYTSAYLFVRLMAKNIYTEQFYTKAETETRLTETATGVEASVNATLTNYDTTSEVNGKLALKLNTQDLVSEFNVNVNRVEIHSDNFNLDANGKITATEGDIAGFEMTSTKFNKYVNGLYDCSIYDVLLCLETYLERLHIDNGTKTILDYNNDGEVNLVDGVNMLNVINGRETNTKTVTGTFSINSDNPKNCLVIKNSSDEEAVSLGVNGVKASNIYGNIMIIADMEDETTASKNMVEIDGKTGKIFVKNANANYTSEISSNTNGSLFIPYGIRYGINNEYYLDSVNSYLPSLIVENGALIGNRNNNTVVNVYGEIDCFGNPAAIRADGYISTSGNMYAQSFIPSSMEANKKNIEEFDKSALDIINETDIYKYHYKNEDKKDKKHIGFVIGKDYNYSKELTDNKNEGVDLYSFVSVCCKAIQEQQKEIEELKEEIKKMKESDK